MNQPRAVADDRPLPPPEPESEGSMLRWVVAAAAVLLLMVGAYHAYDWLVSDISQRRAVAEGRAPEPQPAPVQQAAPPTAAPAARPTPAPVSAGEARAPAVAGGGVNKCVQDGHVTYTNEPCPDGSSSVAANQAEPPALALRPVMLADGAGKGQLDALCRYLAAEQERLDFEFKQPLPPPVLDHISTRLNTLRAQSQAAACTPQAKPAAAKPATASKRPARKVVEEKAGD